MVYGTIIHVYQRYYLVVLIASSFGISTTSECNSFGVRNEDNDDGDWEFTIFPGYPECLMCFRWTSSSQSATLVLPCLLHDQSYDTEIAISYFYRPGNITGHGLDPLLREMITKEECQAEYRVARQLSAEPVMSSTPLPSGIIIGRFTITVSPINSFSYRLGTSGNIPTDSFVCISQVRFMNVRLSNCTTVGTVTTTVTSKFTHEAIELVATSKGPKTNTKELLSRSTLGPATGTFMGPTMIPNRIHTGAGIVTSLHGTTEVSRDQPFSEWIIVLLCAASFVAIVCGVFISSKFVTSLYHRKTKGSENGATELTVTSSRNSKRTEGVSQGVPSMDKATSDNDYEQVGGLQTATVTSTNNTNIYYQDNEKSNTYSRHFF